MGDKRKLDNATGKWDLLKANLHMYKFAMTQEFLAGKLDLPFCSSCMVPGDLTFLLGNLW